MSAKQPDLWAEQFYRSVNPQVLSVGFHQAVPGWRSAPRKHRQTDFDIWHIADGAGAVQVGNTWHEFQAGDVITIKPGEDYCRERTDDAFPFRIYYTHLLPFGQKTNNLTRALARYWPRKITLAHDPRILSLFEEMLEAYATQPNGYPLQLKALAIQILAILFAELRKPSAPEQPRAYAKLLRVKTLIERDYATDLSLDKIASSCELSVSHLSALFRKHIGYPPIEYLLRVRLREAKLRLARAEPVSRVARAVGFHSLHYFSRIFKQKAGISPTQFTRLHSIRHHNSGKQSTS